MGIHHSTTECIGRKERLDRGTCAVAAWMVWTEGGPHTRRCTGVVRGTILRRSCGAMAQCGSSQAGMRCRDGHRHSGLRARVQCCDRYASAHLRLKRLLFYITDE
jgi:hypothetical protein